MPQTLEITECVICQRPLGAESRDIGYTVCHEHRKCSKCGRDCQQSEIRYCLTHNLAITHARELTLTIKELDVEIELLNISRLTFWPDPTLGRATLQQTTTTQFNALIPLLNHEQILLIMDQAQAISAACSLALSKNRREIEQEISDREKSRFESAKKDRVNATKTVADKKAETAEQKSLKMFMNLGMTEEQAKAQLAALKAAKKDMLK